jgi:hypothetical protein
VIMTLESPNFFSSAFPDCASPIGLMAQRIFCAAAVANRSASL